MVKWYERIVLMRERAEWAAFYSVSKRANCSTALLDGEKS